MTIKEYADKHGKSVQSVYKQMKSKENAKRLEGHIFLRKIGNKNVQVLDEVAISVLEEASTQAPHVIVQMEDKEQIARLQEENKELLVKLTEVQKSLLNAKEQSLLVEQQKLLLEDKQKQLDELEAENEDLKGYNEWCDEELKKHGKYVEEALQEKKQIEQELEEIKKMNVFRFMKYKKKGNT
jgi:hypothetical protein